MIMLLLAALPWVFVSNAIYLLTPISYLIRAPLKRGRTDTLIVYSPLKALFTSRSSSPSGRSKSPTLPITFPITLKVSVS